VLFWAHPLVLSGDREKSRPRTFKKIPLFAHVGACCEFINNFPYRIVLINMKNDIDSEIVLSYSNTK
jgi:hypothetical protein